ncbi:MAG: UDP-N-acetylmuramate dehydrogenase [Tissierellia bacterium]|nr:UDP-N-acetylmuramate dehydrogenase [Tissierellia bacterium]
MSEFKNVGTINYNASMKDYTSFKIGGPADILIEPSSIEELKNAIVQAKEFDLPYMILGNGSNVLVSDKGIRGVVIRLGDKFSEIEVNDCEITAMAGAKVSTVSKTALKHSLTGMEEISGIPGSVGGGVMMNAGAYGGEFKDIVKEVLAMDRDLNLISLNNEELNFRYRGSKISDDNLIVLKVVFELEKGDYEKIQNLMREVTEKRNTKQPLTLPSAGSVFKRPKGHYAAKLIEDANLKGLRHKGAQVSEKHSGFIVNIDNATAQDVMDLIGVVRKTVYDKFGVNLEREIRIIGEI